MQQRVVLIAAAALIALAAARLARRFRRYEIAGVSMLPALRPGDWVLVDVGAFRTRWPRPGEVALAMDPRLEQRTLVKRVDAVDGGLVRLLGDNAAASTDSRTLGSFPADLVLGRVRWRYWPPPLGSIR